jgi:intracellular sulfur oxidation DsrE/DsrF family protein
MLRNGLLSEDHTNIPENVTMKHLIRMILLSLTLSPLIVNAFDGWPGDQSITRKTPAMMEKANERAPIHAVFQVSDGNPDSWKVTLGSAIETIKALGDKRVTIEIVAFGPGVDGLKRGSEWAAMVKQVLDAGARIMVSETAMAALHYTHDDMLPNLQYVPVGAVEILQKQKSGYLYLRP